MLGLCRHRRLSPIDKLAWLGKVHIFSPITNLIDTNTSSSSLKNISMKFLKVLLLLTSFSSALAYCVYTDIDCNIDHTGQSTYDMIQMYVGYKQNLPYHITEGIPEVNATLTG